MNKAETSIIISGQSIPWSFIQKVRRFCGGDWDQTMDIFWKARETTGHNAIIRYVTKGMVDGSKGKKWLLIPSREREAGKMGAVRQWWEGLYQRKPKATTMSFKDALKAMAAGM